MLYELLCSGKLQLCSSTSPPLQQLQGVPIQCTVLGKYPIVVYLCVVPCSSLYFVPILLCTSLCRFTCR